MDSERNKIGLAHFNVSDLVALKAVFEAARKLNAPVVIGVSEGERDFLGVKQIAALVRSLRAAPSGGEPRPVAGREENEFPIFLNADHTHSLEKIEEAAKAGFDAIIADGSKLPLEENIAFTKKAVDMVKSISPNTLVEGEVGYIGSGSSILKEIPQGAAVTAEQFTKPEEAERFVQETGVDLFAPAVGNIHGMLANSPNPQLDAERIRQIRQKAGVPLVLHGGSGIADEDFLKAIEAGIALIHISTELRVAWRKALEDSLKINPDEIAPYKLLGRAVDSVQRVAEARIRLFRRSD